MCALAKLFIRCTDRRPHPSRRVRQARPLAQSLFTWGLLSFRPQQLTMHFLGVHHTSIVRGRALMKLHVEKSARSVPVIAPSRLIPPITARAATATAARRSARSVSFTEGSISLERDLCARWASSGVLHADTAAELTVLVLFADDPKSRPPLHATTPPWWTNPPPPGSKLFKVFIFNKTFRKTFQKI